MATRSFEQLFQQFGTDIRKECSELLNTEAKKFSEFFYTALMNDDEALSYLNNEMVQNRLVASFAAWAAQVFSSYSDEHVEDLEALHLRIGTVHARIGIPMHLNSFGMQTVRDHAISIVMARLPEERRNQGVSYVNNLLDTCLATMNQSYLDRTVVEERNAQQLRFKMDHTELALECERMRSELIAWSRDLALSQNWTSTDFSARENSIYSTVFGLWLTHKAEIFFPDYREVTKIRSILVQIDATLRSLSALAPDDHLEQQRHLQKIREHVDQVGWFIAQIIEKNKNEYQSKDSLTQLINRRFMDSVLKREIQVSRLNKEQFAALMIDIDNFKKINDTYGHPFGDVVLQEVAAAISQSVRVTDFCFRYGGEEIMVVIPNTDVELAARRAEAVRQAIEDLQVKTETGEVVPVTASIGIGMYNGHPDFERVLEEADNNLYHAKRNGKNRVSSERMAA